jgi:hypothetical protein
MVNLVSESEFVFTSTLSKSNFWTPLFDSFKVPVLLNEEVCRLTIVATITSLGVKFNTKVTWLKELNISSIELVNT